MDNSKDLSRTENIEEFYTFNKLLKITRSIKDCTSKDVDSIIEKLDTSRGVMLSSRYEYPGRYTRFDIGFVNPPLVIEVIKNKLIVKSLNLRGDLLLKVFHQILDESNILNINHFHEKEIVGEIILNSDLFFEEDRSKAPHVLNVLRLLLHALKIDDSHIGFYGAFGYDLGLDFMGVKRLSERDENRDLVLYFADEIFVTDHERNTSKIYSYDFEILKTKQTTNTLERSGDVERYIPDKDYIASRDFSDKEYSDIVVEAKRYFTRGDLFEVVPSYSFNEPCVTSPSVIFNTLLTVNPAPYGALINMGNNEFTISASPEMFVRVEDNRVESCPIAGTIARGTQGVSDAEQIEKLLLSEKEDSELIMCTDVDRNDKSRVCVPSSVQVIGRRQIEIYSRLIHTVDHVQGTLLDEFDSIDAFLTHMWAVTVTGAPKMWACRFIEKYEKSSRRFYGGAMGAMLLDGSMNTGLMLRTIHLDKGAAHIRVGATLHFDSDPDEETKETELKASAMLDVVRYCNSFGDNDDSDNPIVLTGDIAKGFVLKDKTGSDMNISNDVANGSAGTMDQDKEILYRKSQVTKNILLIDCEDSFVHTLGSYFRMANCNVKTLRIGFEIDELEKLVKEFKPSLICLSPGPGSPKEFGLNIVISKIREMNIPIFGVCLGLQAIVEYFGGTLSQLDTPMHGKKSDINIIENNSKMFKGIKSPFSAGRYHSLYANKDSIDSNALKIVAQTTNDDIVMAVEHVSEPIAAVQFHP